MNPEQKDADKTPVTTRRALVTGGSRGIGRGIALVLAAEGYDLAITYATQRQQAEAVAAEIKDRFARRCCIIQGDLSLPDVAREVVEKAAAELGGLELLVNNAGVTRFNPEVDEDMEQLELLFNLNFKAVLQASATAARHMIDRGAGGSIINITSTRGERAYPDDAYYGGLKAALKRATESLALKYAPYNIRVNCVAPGATASLELQQQHPYLAALAARIPLRRLGTPEDVGQTVAWLASYKASYITGITIRIDGGLILPGMPEWDVPDNAVPWGAKRNAAQKAGLAKPEGTNQ